MPDKWGHPFLYPSKKTAGVSGSGSGFFWQQANDIREDSKAGSLDDVSNVNTSTGEFTINYGSSDSWTIRKDPSFDNTNSIGGCNMDFADCEKRGYGWKADQPRDVEIKMLIKVEDDGGGEGLSIGGPTGRHSGDGCCSGFNYMLNLFLADDPVKFRFRKEMWHVNYDNDPKTGVWTHSKANFKLVELDRFIGIAFCRYNLKDHRGDGKDSVACEAWINPDPAADKNTWTMMKRTIDTGGWGDGGDECNGENSQVGTWSNGQFRIKSDSGVVIRFKNCSLREIDPSIDFDDPGDDDSQMPDPVNQPSQTTTITGSFVLQRDINIASTTVCAAAGLKSFYDRLSTLDADIEDDHLTSEESRTRVGCRASNSSSKMVGKIIKQVDVYLKKQGSPAASPTVDCKIYDSGGAVKYTSTTNLDPTTLTTSYALKSFDCTTNTYAMQTGDKIAIVYTGTSADDYVTIPIRIDNPELNDQLAVFTGSTWNNYSSRDFNGRLYEDS